MMKGSWKLRPMTKFEFIQGFLFYLVKKQKAQNFKTEIQHIIMTSSINRKNLMNMTLDLMTGYFIVTLYRTIYKEIRKENKFLDICSLESLLDKKIWYFLFNTVGRKKHSRKKKIG